MTLDDAFAGNTIGTGNIQGARLNVYQAPGPAQSRAAASAPACRGRSHSEGQVDIFLSSPFRRVPGAIGHVTRIRAALEEQLRQNRPS